MIGIIGGAGPLASALLYQLILEEHYRRTRRGQQCPLPEIVLLNHVFMRGLTLDESTANRFHLASELKDCIGLLRKVGATRIGIACNTLHSFLPQAVCEDLIHLPQRVMASLRRQGVVKAGVLSTETTKRAGLYSDPTIEFVHPAGEDQLVVNSILDHILDGCIRRSDSLKIQKVILNMKVTHGITAIILGCTDLPVLHRHYSINVPGICVFDSIRILSEEILEQQV